jgi:DnaK suppressor protein
MSVIRGQFQQAALEKKLADLSSRGLLREKAEDRSCPDTLDHVLSSADGEVAVIRLEGRARLLRDVRSALARRGGGAYGLCGECPEPIPAKRLDAMPRARLCVRCQGQSEAPSRQSEMSLDEAA